jgi:RNA polymerase sigma factor (sigma-70 family)
MNEHDWLAQRFDEQQPMLRALARRMLGSEPEADRAIESAKLELIDADRTGAGALDAWLVMVVAGACVTMLRSRHGQRHYRVDGRPAARPGGSDEVATTVAAPVADSVALALMVVLEMLAPEERLAFVLHDLFAVPFEEIASMLECSPIAAARLAHRARHRLQQPASGPSAGA